MRCPLPGHKEGRERTASFGYNFETDRFHCFGCGVSGGTVEYIHRVEGEPRGAIAARLAHHTDVDLLPALTPQADLAGFAVFAGDLLHRFRAVPEALEQIEKVYWWLDDYMRRQEGGPDQSGLCARLDRAREVLAELAEEYE